MIILRIKPITSPMKSKCTTFYNKVAGLSIYSKMYILCKSIYYFTLSVKTSGNEKSNGGGKGNGNGHGHGNGNGQCNGKI